MSVYRKNVLAEVAEGSPAMREEIAAAAARCDRWFFFCDKCGTSWIFGLSSAEDGSPDVEMALRGWEYLYLSENDIPVAMLCNECALIPDAEILASKVGERILERFLEHLECPRADS